MRRRLLPLAAGLFGLLLFTPRPGLAQWVGWYGFGTQGSYVHLMAHLLFGAAMLFFIYEIHQAGFARIRGFRFLNWAWAFLALWNFDAFIGHTADWTLQNPVILGQGFSRRLLMENAQTWLVYLTKIDHFLFLIPAFILFYCGLKALVRYSKADRS